MDTHEIILFGNEAGGRIARSSTRITATNDLREVAQLLADANVRACVIDCDDTVEDALALIAERRPELTVALCERIDFQRLVVATETARLYRLRVVAGLWRQCPGVLIEQLDQLIRAEHDDGWGAEPIRTVVAPLRAERHRTAQVQIAHH